MKNNLERYQRQLLLKDIGEDGQQKLFDSKVLVCGAGGLGSPALTYLAAAGIGHIGFCDFRFLFSQFCGSIKNLHV